MTEELGSPCLPSVDGTGFRCSVANLVGQRFCWNCSAHTWPTHLVAFWCSQRNTEESPHIASDKLPVEIPWQFLSRDSLEPFHLLWWSLQFCIQQREVTKISWATSFWNLNPYFGLPSKIIFVYKLQFRQKNTNSEKRMKNWSFLHIY